MSDGAGGGPSEGAGDAGACGGGAGEAELLDFLAGRQTPPLVHIDDLVNACLQYRF